MRKILVMIPHGEIYGRDDVRAYHHRDIAGNLDRYYNMGDLFVYDASLKLLDFDYVEVMRIDQVSDYEMDRYNNEFDYCFLRGSNYLHEDMHWEYAIEVLEKLKIPVIPFGIGAQAPEGKLPHTSEQTRRVMRMIADRCSRVGVRGAFSAEVLNSFGIQNIEIIGCPTVFRARNPALHIDPMPLDGVQAAGFCQRREVDMRYTVDALRYLALQRSMIENLYERFGFTLMTQGELEEKQIFYRSAQHIPDAIHSLTSIGWFYNESDPLYDIYRHNMFYSEKVADYSAMFEKLDLVVTFRLHGALMALAAGTPAVLYTYDSRSRECADTFAIPGADIYTESDIVLERFYTPDAFAKFNAAYQRQYAVIHDFLGRNGMPHRLPAPLEAAA